MRMKRMAATGKRPVPPHLRVVGTAHAAKVPIDPSKEQLPDFDNGLQPPKKLSQAERKIWDETIRKASWLTKFDIMRAYMYVNLTARYLKDPDSFNGSMLNSYRAIGSELGLDPSARTRIKIPSHAKTKASEFFD